MFSTQTVSPDNKLRKIDRQRFTQLLPVRYVQKCSTASSRSRISAGLLVMLLCSVVLPGSMPEIAHAQSTDCALYTSPHQRIGYNVTGDNGTMIDDYDAARLGAGWYHDYRARFAASRPGGIRHVQMIHANVDTSTLAARYGAIVDANPGDTWILGNEPDRWGQDERTPAEYAVFYHAAYTFLKDRDPTSIISPAGLVQPTPIRLRYLDMVLNEYQSRYGTLMPVDQWDMHAFILREDETWGAGIPVGLTALPGEAIFYDLSDHGDINIFKQNLRNMRKWMKDRGYRNVPLRISEMGILMPLWAGYDYDSVRVFMNNSFDFMLSATDEETGYPADGNRLIQEFAWFSLNYYTWEPVNQYGTNGALFDHDTAVIQPLGIDFENYVKSKRVETIDLALTSFRSDALNLTTTSAVVWDVDFYNQGGVPADDVEVQFWNGNPAAGGELLGSSPIHTIVDPGCQSTLTAKFIWVPPAPGSYTIYAQLVAANINLETDMSNNVATVQLEVTQGTGATITPTTTPTNTSTPMQTATPTQTATAIPTSTATATPTPTVTSTPTATNIGGVSNTPTVTPTATATPTSTGTVTPIATVTSTSTPTQATPVRTSEENQLFIPLVNK